MNVEKKVLQQVTRRQLFEQCGIGVGKAALTSLFVGDQLFSAPKVGPQGFHHTPRAKNVIYLFMAGAPSQFELFERKPELQKLNGKEIPSSMMEGKRFAFMESFVRNPPKLLGTPARVQAAWRIRPLGVGVFAPRSQGGRQPELSPLRSYGKLQPRASKNHDEHRHADLRPPEHGVVGELRHRQRIERAARIRGAAVGAARPSRRGDELGQRFSADGSSRDSVSERWRAHPEYDEPGGV